MSALFPPPARGRGVGKRFPPPARGRGVGERFPPPARGRGVGERSPPPEGGGGGWGSRVDPCEVRGFDQQHSPPPQPSPERGWELASAPFPLQGGGEGGGRAS